MQLQILLFYKQLKEKNDLKHSVLCESILNPFTL